MDKKIKLMLIVLGVFVVIVLSLSFIGSLYNRDVKYYKNISDIVIGMYRSPEYDNSGISKEDKKYLESYLATLTHENHIVDLSKFMEGADSTSASNSPNVFIENNKCFIKYDDLNFVYEYNDEEDFEQGHNHGTSDQLIILNCMGKELLINNYDFYPEYNETLENPLYDYNFIGYTEEDNIFNSFYRSIYNGSTVILEIKLNNNDIESIEVRPVNINNYEIIN